MTLSFPFSAEFNRTYINKTINISFIKPQIDIKFNESGIVGRSKNNTFYSLSFINDNNVPINLSFSFLLYINGNPFTYNTWRLIYPGQDTVNISLPYGSNIANVNITYINGNGQVTKQNIFSKEVIPTQNSQGISNSLILFIMLSIAIILISILVYLKLIRKNV